MEKLRQEGLKEGRKGSSRSLRPLLLHGVLRRGNGTRASLFFHQSLIEEWLKLPSEGEKQHVLVKSQLGCLSLSVEPM